MTSNLKKIITRGLLLAAGLGLLVLVAGGIFLATPAALLPEASAALQSTSAVQFSDANGWLTFTPADAAPATGVIFYPGGRVPAAAYAPAAAALAAQGYLAVVVPMPFNLAFFGLDRADAVLAAHPEIEHWAIGGHSLGGAMAAEYAARRPGRVQGLFFWASYSASDLSQQALRVVSVYGSLENGRPGFIADEARARVPATTAYIEIAGGNHEQFGYYTGQPNDPEATLPRADQQAQAVAATLSLLDVLDASP